VLPHLRNSYVFLFASHKKMKSTNRHPQGRIIPTHEEACTSQLMGT